jgi:hypothetical protein
VIVTMHASKLKIKQEQNKTYKNYDSKYIKKGKDTPAHRSLILLPELERRLDWTLNSQQGFAYATTTKPEPLQVEYGILNSIDTGVFIGVQGGLPT